MIMEILKLSEIESYKFDFQPPLNDRVKKPYTLHLPAFNLKSTTF